MECYTLIFVLWVMKNHGVFFACLFVLLVYLYEGNNLISFLPMSSFSNTVIFFFSAFMV